MARSKSVSIRDVAAACGVSATTVSLILNDRSDEYRIAPTTRDKVLESAKLLGYTSVGSLRRRSPVTRTALWCIFAPMDFETGPIGDLFQGVEGYARDHDVAVETVLFPYRKGQLASKAPWISKEFCHGAIMVGLDEVDGEFVENTAFDVPLVVFNRAAKQHDSVTIDNYSVGQSAMRHFLSRGHKRFGIVAPSAPSRSRSLRAVGFHDELGPEAASSDATGIVTASADISYGGGAQATYELLASDQRPTAIFVLNDTMVGGVMQALAAQGVKVPENMEVVSFGDAPINSILQPTVTSFAVSTQDMATDCARLLAEAGATQGPRSPSIRMFDAELIIRESSPNIAV